MNLNLIINRFGLGLRLISSEFNLVTSLKRGEVELKVMSHNCTLIILSFFKKLKIKVSLKKKERSQDDLFRAAVTDKKELIV